MMTLNKRVPANDGTVGLRNAVASTAHRLNAWALPRPPDPLTFIKAYCFILYPSSSNEKKHLFLVLSGKTEVKHEDDMMFIRLFTANRKIAWLDISMKVAQLKEQCL